MAEKGNEGDRKKRVVVKKVAVDSSKEPSPPPEPPQTKKVQRKVVTKTTALETKKVRKVSQQSGQQTAQKQVVKKTVVPRQVEGEAPSKPVEVERVVVRQKPREPVPTSPDQLESGFNYLIEEPQPKRSFEFFKAKVSKGAKGLCISTSYPSAE